MNKKKNGGAMAAFSDFHAGGFYRLFFIGFCGWYLMKFISGLLLPPREYYSLFDPNERGLIEAARIYKDGSVETFFGYPAQEAAQIFWKVVMEQKHQMKCEKRNDPRN